MSACSRKSAIATDPGPTPTGMHRVTILTEGDNFRSVHAWLYGAWVAHRAVVGIGWTVTYLPAGRDLEQHITEAQARRCAAWLDDHITRTEMLDWSAPGPDVIARIYQGIAIATARLVDKELAS